MLTELRDSIGPFDRLIGAQAIAEGETLLTKDERIRKHLELAVWDED